MAKDPSEVINQKLDTIIGLLQRLLALELARSGVPREKIAKHLRTAAAAVVGMLQGVKKAE